MAGSILLIDDEDNLRKLLRTVKNGAEYVETYPVHPDSRSYRFMGYKSIFNKMNFGFKHKAGQRRYVMMLKT